MAALNELYEAVVVARNPVLSGPATFTELDRIVPLKSIAWSKELNRDGFGSVSIAPQDLPTSVGDAVRDPANNPIELWVYRNGIKVFAGPIIGYQIQGEEHTMTLVSRSILYYLRWMLPTQDYDWSTGEDPLVIAKTLIDDWQALTYGHFDIDTSTMGTSATSRELVIRKSDLQTVSRIITDLQLEDTGFDFYIDPITRDFITGTPIIGSDISNTFIIDNRNLRATNIFIDMTAGDFGTYLIMSGTDPDLTAPLIAERTSGENAFGRVGLGINFDGVLSQATLDRYADAAIQTFSLPRLQLGSQGSSTHIIVVEDIGPMDVTPGDTVAFQYDAGFGAFDELRDVLAVYVSAQEDGAEDVSLGLL